MSKTMKYQLTERSFIVLNVTNEQDELFIRKMNNEMDKQKKRNRTYKKHCCSLEAYMEATKKEPVYEGKGIDEIVELNAQQMMVRLAINKLPTRQRETIKAVFYDEKSLREIAKERGQDISTVRESYHGAIKKLKDLLKNL